MGGIDISGKAILVTGASKGIGRAIALELADLSCPLFLVARGQMALDSLRSEIRSQWPSLPCEVYAADVSDPMAVRRAVELMVDRIGPPEGVMCNAGFARPGYFEEIPDDVIKRLVEVNYLGAAYTVRAVLPHLKPGGLVSLTSSVLGYMGAFGSAPYAATKFALVGFAESLRQELKPRGIYVSVLCPPDTDTPGYEKENETKPRETRELSESAGLVTPQFVARRYLRGLRSGRFLINVNLASEAYYRLHGWAPELVRSTMDWMVSRTQARMKKEGVL